jgi:hypothetical protein
MKSTTAKEPTMKRIATSTYVRLVAVLTVAVPLAVTCGHLAHG